jgi:hypothetical protein
MSIHQKAYRYRLLPTPEQEGRFRQFAGARSRDEGLRLLLAEGCPESIINAS